MINFTKKFQLHKIPILVIIMISLYLVVTWLPKSAIIAGGDVGIPNLLPREQLKDVVSSWWDRHATGVASPTTYTSIPYYVILFLFESIGMGPDITQKVVFFVIIVGGAMSIYFLGLIFSFTWKIAFFASLFYIFNLTSLSVWQRGVHNGMLMLLLAPLSLLILAWGIKKRRYSSIILINIVSFVLSYVFGALGYVFSLWLLWTIYILTVLLDNWSEKTVRKFLLTFSVLLIISWIGTNSWWIIHLLQSSGYVLGQFAPEELKARGSDVLFGLKPYHNPLYILRGLSAFYHYGIKDWGDSYLNPLILLLSWIPVLVIFSTALFRINYKLVYWKFLIILTVIILVLSKGVNAPLGLLNAWPYDLFPFLAPLRNPYEKVGILLAIPFSLLFAYGLNQINNFFKQRKMSYLNLPSILIAFFCLTVLVWPLWLGKIFVSEGRKYSVSIPSYYAQANNWLESKIALDDSRILHLPLSSGESIDYNWGYTGVEPSQYFFNGSSIGYQIGIPSVDSRIRDVLISIHNQDDIKIQKALASLNIGWVVIHNETVWRPRVLESTERINTWLSRKPDFLEHQADFGPLSIYRVRDEYRLGHFYPEGKLIAINKSNNTSSLKIWDDIEKLNDGFLTELQKDQEEILGSFIEKNIIFPKGKIKYLPFISVNAETALKELSPVNYFENVLGFLNQNDQVRECFNLSGKRLKEAALFARDFKPPEAKKALSNYEKQLNKCTKISSETLSIYLNTESAREEILGQLIRQRVVLENEFNDSATAEEGIKVKRILTEYLAKLGLSPKYEPKRQTDGEQLIVFDYSVAKDGEYEIKINNPDKDLLISPPKVVQIDNQSVEVSATEISEKAIKYPSFKFEEGFHEIHLQVKVGQNLIEKSLEFKKLNPDIGFRYGPDAINQESAFSGETVNNQISLTFDMPNLDIESSYEATFDMYFYQGSRPVITITHDTDPLDSVGQLQPAVVREIGINSYPVELKGVKLNYNPPLNASTAKISFILVPPNIQNSFVNSTKALIKNIKVEKVFNSDLVLEESKAIPARQLGSVDLKWNKINPTLYDLDLTSQTTPYILVFSETFHPLWQIENSNGKRINSSHFSVNGFANGWLIEEPLPQEVRVEFVLQDNFKRGIAIAAITFITSLVILLYLDYRIKLR